MEHAISSFLLYELNGKSRLKKLGPQFVLLKEEDVIIVAWIIVMQKCGLFKLPYNG
jgi:hypothetical protein